MTYSIPYRRLRATHPPLILVYPGEPARLHALRYPAWITDPQRWTLWLQTLLATPHLRPLCVGRAV
jgi:hypothetical protein